MAAEYHRTDRVGTQIQRALADLIRDQVNDPRLGLVTIQAVRVSRDLAYAKVYFTMLQQDADADAITKVLERARGFLRHELGRALSLRTVPELSFVYDKSVEHGTRLSALIDRAVAADTEKHH